MKLYSQQDIHLKIKINFCTFDKLYSFEDSNSSIQWFCLLWFPTKLTLAYFDGSGELAGDFFIKKDNVLELIKK